MSGSPLRLVREGTVMIVVVDNPPVNALSTPVRAALLDAVRAIDADPGITAAVIRGEDARFMAGADIREQELPLSPPGLNEVVEAIAASPKPFVAVIEGAALGGGLELALACDLRVATQEARLGLTETTLGIVPGAGGITRLTHLVGPVDACRLVASGAILDADEALRLGIVDAVVAADDALTRGRALARTARKTPVTARPFAAAPADAIAAERRRLTARPVARAVLRAAELVEAVGTAPPAATIAAEREAFLALRDGPEARAMRYLFFAERLAAKSPDGPAPRSIATAAVVGAGTMGRGIAMALADAGLPVVLLDASPDVLAAAGTAIDAHYRRQAATGRLSVAVAEARRACVRLAGDLDAAAGADLAIEAVFEDMEVKSRVLAGLAARLGEGSIIASNTSYLDLDRLAEASGRPADVVGLHFFAPANVMRLLEIVRGEATADDVIAAALALARRLRKQPIVARVGEGFIANRVFAAYRQAAERLVEGGANPYAIDATLEDFGMAMGVFAVCDLAGLDIARARRRRLAAAGRVDAASPIADALCDAGRLGRKAGAGWYGYDGEGRRQPDPAVLDLIASVRSTPPSPSPDPDRDDARHLVAVMAAEGGNLLAEGIAARESDIDVAMVNGFGFPRHRGGPMWLARNDR